MRTAIRTYQSGGPVDGAQLLDERYFPPTGQGDVTGPVTSSPQTVQAQAPPPAPPPSAIDPSQQPPPFMRQQAPPPTAIQTTPPAGDFTDHDVDLPRKTQMENEAWQITRSHRGGKGIVDKPPPEITTQEHPEWENYKRAVEIFNGYDEKTKKAKRPQLDHMLNKIDADTRAANKKALAQHTAEQKQALLKVDEERVAALKVPELNSLIDDGLSKVASVYDDVIKKGAPQDAQAMAMKREMSPLNTMTNLQQKYVIRNIMGLNRDLDADQAAQLLVVMGQPPEHGKPGVNGLKGRAATNYKPDSIDAIGNRQVVVPSFGTIRIAPEMLELIEKAHRKGYDNGLKYKSDLASKRTEAAKPDWFTRNVTQPVTDAASRAIR